MELYKDKNGINHRPVDVQYDFIANLAEICDEAFEDLYNKDNVLKEKLGMVDNISLNTKHNPNHKACDGCDSARMTEKRICRCMYYYNQDKLPKLCLANNCSIKLKWKNTGKIEVVEYEWPTEFVTKGVGGIDLILKDQDETYYGCEVKPCDSDETLGRMVAEILSYTIGTPYSKTLKPAIAVFNGSEQYKMLVRLHQEDNKNWERIEKYIQVFVITYDTNDGEAKFCISPYM